MEPQNDSLDLEHKLQQNKVNMIKIMKEAPIAGAYLGEDPLHWDNFFQFYINFLNSETGPRGQCTKYVRLQLAKDPQLYDQILSLLKLSHKSNIRDIYTKFKLYSPSPHYDKLLKLQESLGKATDSNQKINDENSIMYNKIKTGMIEKRGIDYDYAAQIDKIRQNYKQKITKLQQQQTELQTILSQTENYLHYIKLRDIMHPYFQKWKEADTRIGHEGIEKGDCFEKIVENKLLPIICRIANIQHKQIKVLKNCRWVPRNLGEIDIAIAEKFEQEWRVIVVIECKSRLFDVRQAHKQVAKEHFKQKNKQKLSTLLGILSIDDSVQSFIVTTLPQHPFIFPIESKMKEALERPNKNKAISEIESGELRKAVSEKFIDDLSPLDWFTQNDSDHIIVWSYDL